jgi:hypothetical protein
MAFLSNSATESLSSFQEASSREFSSPQLNLFYLLPKLLTLPSVAFFFSLFREAITAAMDGESSVKTGSLMLP